MSTETDLQQRNKELEAEVEAVKKQHEIDNKGNREWIESLCQQLCKMEDALGFKNDCYDKKGAWVPTIGPWLERVRDLLAAEGELGDAKAEIEALKREVKRWQENASQAEAVGRVRGLRQAAAQDRSAANIHRNPDLSNVCEDCASDREYIIDNTPELKAVNV